MKIGITERGDASIDYNWVNKLNTVDGAIIITKNLTDKFIDTILEQLNQLKKLVDLGFNPNHIVLRVDPIKNGYTPCYDGFYASTNQLRNVISVLDKFPITYELCAKNELHKY